MNNLIKEKPSKLDHVEETLSVVVAGVTPAVEPWRPARRKNRTPKKPAPFAYALRKQVSASNSLRQRRPNINSVGRVFSCSRRTEAPKHSLDKTKGQSEKLEVGNRKGLGRAHLVPISGWSRWRASCSVPPSLRSRRSRKNNQPTRPRFHPISRPFTPFQPSNRKNFYE